MTSRRGRPDAIAVIIPVRDGAAFLAAAIDSIIAQAGDHVEEIVVVDDGSRDESAAIAKSRAGIRCICQPPLGVAAALNSGLDATTEPLVGFLDADDIMPSDSLATRHAVIANDRDCDVVVGRMVQFMDSGAASEVRQRLRVDSRPTLGYLAGTSLARRKVFDRVGKFDPAPGATTFLDWVLRARHAGVRFCETDAVVLERRVHGGNISLDRPAMQSGYLMTLRRHFARQRNIDPGKS